MDSTTINLGGGSSAIYTPIDSIPGRGQLTVSIPDPLTGGGLADFTGHDTASIVSQLNEMISNFGDVAQKNPSMAAHSKQQIAAYRKVISQLGSTSAVQRVIDADAADTPPQTATPQPDAPNATAATQTLTSTADINIKESDKIKDGILGRKPPTKSIPNVDDGVVSITGPKWTGAGGGRGGQGGPTALQATQNNAIKATAPVEIPKPMPNPLHNYATYTYGLTLYILSAEDFNNLQKADANQLDAWKPTYALISSGGGHQSDRNPAFKDDFYFDNFKLSTIIGLNAMSRGTNAIQLSFSVIEPYGLTLLDRIIDAAQQVGSKNYLSQPYLIEIDFYGTSDLGAMTTPIKNLRKRIPLQFLDMKIKASARGSEYQINAIPYNHAAFSENSASTPANFEVTARTVKDFFNNTATNFADQIAAKNKAKADKERAEKPPVSVEGTFNQDGEIELRTTTKEPDKKAAEAASIIINSPYTTESYTGAVNAWNQKIVDNTHYKYSNEIEFVLDDEFANSPIVIPSKTNPVRSSFSGTSAADKKASAQGNDPNVSNSTPSAEYNKEQMNFNINAGTSVIDVINMVMRNSEYIRNQVKDPTAGEVEFQQDKTVNYFKIIPQVVLKEFDSLRNTYATKTIYHIKKFSYFNSKHPNLPYGSPDGAVKEYNYIYTGKNIDILDFNIEFNTAYYTTKVVDRDNKETINSAPNADTENKPDKGVPPTGSGPDSIAGNKSMPVSAEMNTAATGADTAKTALVANAMGSIYTNSGADMLSVNFKILGDPHFVKQDDLYTNPGMTNYNDKKVMINSGTVAMDNKEIFCKISFKTPVDMDPATGLTRLDGKYTVSKFSGFYKIIKVDSEFSRGQFVQTIEAVRIFDKSKVTYVSSPDRDEQTLAKTEQDGSSTDSRTLAIPDPTAQAADSNSNPLKILDNVKNKVEEQVTSAKAAAKTFISNTADSVIADAKNLQQKLANSLSTAKTVDIGTQQTADANSPEPQNPTEYPLP